MNFPRSNINMNSFQEGDKDFNPNSSPKEEMVRYKYNLIYHYIYIENKSR